MGVAFLSNSKVAGLVYPQEYSACTQEQALCCGGAVLCVWAVACR